MRVMEPIFSGTSPQTMRVTFTYMHTLSLSRQSNVEASCTNLFSSSAQISAMDVREFLEN